jgi:hypothetical protein
MATLLLFQITFDKGLAHEVGRKGAVICLALLLLSSFFKFALKTLVPKIPKKHATAVLVLMIGSLVLFAGFATLWLSTRNSNNTEDATAIADSPEENNDYDPHYPDSSVSRTKASSPIINSNANITGVKNSNNTINSNQIINSNVNNPTTNIYNQQYNSTLIQPGNNRASQRVPYNDQSSSIARVSIYPQFKQFTPAPIRTKQNDPDLIRLIQQLRDLRKRGLKEANPDTAYASVIDCLAAFNSWRGECLSLLKRADRIIEERYNEESFSYSTFERDVRMPNEVLQVRDGISSCRRLYLTFAESLDSYIPKL